MRLHQDREVDDAVLLRANQLFAVDDENAFRAAIDDAQVRDAALLGDFRHFHQAQRQRIVQDAVARHSPRRRVAGEQRIHGDGAEHDRWSNDNRRQGGGDGCCVHANDDTGPRGQVWSHFCANTQLPASGLLSAARGARDVVWLTATLATKKRSFGV